MPEGIRNATLSGADFKLGTLVGAGLLDDATVRTTLTDRGETVGLNAREVGAWVPRPAYRGALPALGDYGPGPGHLQRRTSKQFGAGQLKPAYRRGAHEAVSGRQHR